MKDRRRKGPKILLATVAALAGLAAGFWLALALDPGHLRIGDSPFGPEHGRRRMPKGRDFSGVPEWKDLPGADRDRYLKVLQSAEAGASAQALEELATLLKQNPDFSPGRGLSALAVLGLVGARGSHTGMAGPLPTEEAFARAQAAWQSCLARDSTHPYCHYAAGRGFEAARRPDSAESHFLKAIKAAPQFAYPYIGLGRLHLEEGDTRTASLNFRTAIGLLESSPEAYKPGKRLAIPVTEIIPYDLLATLYFQTGAEDSARMALEFGEEKGVRTDRMALVQGWLWESRGFLGKADSMYRVLQARDPGNAAYAEAIATLGWKPRGHASASAPGPGAADAEAIFAISLLDPLARQNPRNAPLWMALGQSYFRRGLFGMATECFDSSLKYDPGLPGLAEKRDAAYQNLIRQAVPARMAARKPNAFAALAPEEQVPVIIPGSNALLGTYSVPWGSSQTQVRQAYPKKTFQTLANGNLMDSFLQEGVRHDYLLAFKEGRLWGIRVYVTDSAGVSGDLFGRIIRTKAKISGEGRGTGEAKCEGFRSLQGAIWENDDTFEFMAQFEGETHKVRLARIGRDFLPKDQRLCELVVYLREDSWK